MKQQENQPKKQNVLVSLKTQLQNAKVDSDFIEILHKIDHELQAVVLDKQTKFSNFLYDILKPITRSLTNSSFKQQQQVALVKQVLLKILKMYINIFKQFHNSNCIQIIRQLLNRDTSLFIPLKKQAHAQMDIEKNNQQQFIDQRPTFQYIIYKHKYTDFYHTCCETVLKCMQGIQKQFQKMSLFIITQYYNLIYHIDDMIIQQKLQNLVISTYQAIQSLFKNPSKQLLKDATKQNIQNMTDVIIKILRGFNNSAYKTKIQLLGAELGLLLLDENKIQRKLQGVKLINKIAINVYIKSLPFLSDLQFGKWMNQNKVFQKIYLPTQSFTLIKSADEIFKIYVRNRLINKQKYAQYFYLIDNCERDLRKFMFKILDSVYIRLQTLDFDIILENCKAIRKVQYYQEQFFVLIEDLARYQYYTQLQQSFIMMQTIVNQYYQLFSLSVQYKCLYTYVKIYTALIDKNSDYQSKLKDSLKIVENFYNNPCKLTITIMKRVLQIYPEGSRLSKYTLTSKIINYCNFLDKVLQILQTNKSLKIDCIDIIKYLMRFYRDDKCSQISHNTILKMVLYPDIFYQLVIYIGFQKEKFFVKMMEKLLQEQFEFVCVKQVFSRLNYIGIHRIDRQLADRQYQTVTDPNKFAQIDLLFKALYETPFINTKKQCAKYICQLFTCYSEERLHQGEKFTKQFIHQATHITKHMYERYKKKQIKEKEFYGQLLLVQQLIGASEPFGCGRLKSHNALVGTSTIMILISNQLTQGQDVAKNFEKKFPSNTTLFEVLNEASQIFKCSPTQIMLKQPSGYVIPISSNSKTLDELNLNFVPLLGIKTYRNRLKQVQLTDGKQLRQRAFNVFKDIYNSYAVDGRMGKKQCANYIEGVTRIACFMHDNRVDNFFKDYDSDNDQNITVEDFIKFYKQSSVERPAVVWKNLKTLRYRSDLKKYNQPVDALDEEVMLRYHLIKDNQTYEMLFNLIKNYAIKSEMSEDNQFDLVLLAEKLLLRLPSYSKITNSLQESLQMLGKSQFQTEYILLAIQSTLLPTNPNYLTAIEQFIKRETYIKIYNFLVQQKRSQKILTIILRILRSLFLIPNLNNNLKDLQDCIKIQQIKLPKTDMFSNLLNQALKKVDLQRFEATIILILTQKQQQLSWLKEAIFNKDIDIRRITCNFIFVLHRNQLINQFDILNIEQQSYLCQQWFDTLTKIFTESSNISFQQIFNKRVNRALSSSQQFNKAYDPILNGNLRIITILFEKFSNKLIIPQDLGNSFIQLLNRTMQSHNRQMIYSLIASLDFEKCLFVLHHLINTIPVNKNVQQKQNFVGLRNLGATCYMNSILQQFFVRTQFRQLIMSISPGPLPQQTQVNGHKIVDNFIYQLQKLYAYLQYSNKKYYDTTQFCLTIKDQTGKKPINTSIQEDAHQFINYIFGQIQKFIKKQQQQINNHHKLQNLDESSKSSNQKSHQQIKCVKMDNFEKLVGGKTSTIITCQTCQNTSTRKQDFNHLSVEVKGKSNLIESLDKFIQVEEIGDYHCELCNKKVPQCTKQTIISSLPQILIINLQRIIFDLEAFQKVKVHSKHQFPHQLSLKNYINSLQDINCQYELTGVVIHSGTSQAGHYYSLIKFANQWYKFNDNSVTKFNIQSLPKQSFGGLEDIDQWGQLQYSTNAYILFYSRKSIDQKIEQEPKCQFVKQVQKQNEQFAKEIQLHQQSFVICILDLYKRIQPENMQTKLQQTPFQQQWDKMQYFNMYDSLLALYIKLVKFLSTFYEFKNQLIYSVGQNFYELSHLVPEKSYQFIMDINIQQYSTILITHNQPIIRQLYKCALNKMIHVYVKYYGFTGKKQNNENAGEVKLYQLFDKLLEKVMSDQVMKNTFKATQFFQFWRFCILCDESILYYTLQNGKIYENLLDLMMGNDSPYKEKYKRAQFYSPQSYPIIQTIIYLSKFKQTLNGYIPEKVLTQIEINYKVLQLTQKEQKILSNMTFYKKMLKQKHDQGMFSQFIAAMCYQNRQFSSKIAEMLINGLSNIDSQEAILPIFSHAKMILILEDSLSSERVKWFLGIPQFSSVTKLEYCIRDNISSRCINYVSNLFFIQSEIYEPLLERLFQKKYRYDILTITGITSILELILYSPRIREYIMNLPAPTYSMRSYLDWIQIYIDKLSNQQHYGMSTHDKNVFAEKLKLIFLQIQELIIKQNYHLPKQKYIVGKNSNLKPQDAIGCADFQITMWRHQTYVLNNRPTGKGNESFNDDMPDYRQLSKYFVYDYKNPEPTDLIQVQATILTLQIDAKKKLKLILKCKEFQHEININSGLIEINLPYTTQRLKDFLEVQVIQQQQKMIEESKQHGPFMPQIKINNRPVADMAGCIETNNSYESQTFLYKQIQCSKCTYLNFGREKCEICDEYLYWQ